jgi:toxin ParE1/3/4
MSVELIWLPDAEADLIEIYLTIALDNQSAAERVYAAMKERAALLAEYPRMGQRRRELAPPARALVVGAYLILYKTYPDSDDMPVERIDVVRVVHGSRDLRRVF